MKCVVRFQAEDLGYMNKKLRSLSMRPPDVEGDAVTSLGNLNDRATNKHKQHEMDQYAAQLGYRCITISNTGSPSFRLHVHHTPERATFSIILGSCIANPPIFINSVLHIRPQYGWNFAMAPWYAIRLEIWSIKPESDVDAAV